ncbi:MAG TPA: ERF family protein [Emticicia sp.]
MDIQSNNSIYSKLHLIQIAVRAIKADKEPTAGATYTYVSTKKLLSIIRPLMNKHGLLLKQEVLSINEIRQDYTTASNKAKTEVLFTVNMRFTWINTETGEVDQSLFAATGMNDFVKGVSSALTSGERLFLLKYFHIVTDEDDYDEGEESEENHKEEKPSPAPKNQPQPKQKAITSEEKKFEEKKSKKLELTPNNRHWWQQAVVWMQNGGSIEEFRNEYEISDFNAALLRKEALNAVA